MSNFTNSPKNNTASWSNQNKGVSNFINTDKYTNGIVALYNSNIQYNANYRYNGQKLSTWANQIKN